MAKILIIDDDKDYVHSLKMLLKPAGYTLYESYSAEDGMRSASEIRPDLIILDVMMETDTAGFQLAYKLRSSAGAGEVSCSQIPILMLTSIGSVKKLKFSPLEDGEYLPVDQFMEKPVQPEILLETVRRLIGGTKS